MGNCLVKKLQSVVDDENLMGLNELRLQWYPTYSYFTSRSCNIKSNITQTLSVANDATFTSNGLKTIEIKANIVKNCAVTDYGIIKIPNKYEITRLYLDNYVPLDRKLSSFKYCKNLTFIAMWGNSSASNKSDYLQGDLSDISELTKLTDLTLLSNEITGDLSSLSKMANLISFNLCSNLITGNLSTLYGFNLLHDALIGSSIVGDAALLPASFKLLNGNSKLTWSNRPTTSNIIAFGYEINNARCNNFGTYLDVMLQNQANCKVGYLESDSASYKKIAVAGTRSTDPTISAATDAAIATLQDKGYTVTIVSK